MEEKNMLLVSFLFLAFILLSIPLVQAQKQDKNEEIQKPSLGIISCDPGVYIGTETGFLGVMGSVWGSNAGIVCKFKTTFTEIRIQFCMLTQGKNRGQCMMESGVFDKLTDKAAGKVGELMPHYKDN